MSKVRIYRTTSQIKKEADLIDILGGSTQVSQICGLKSQAVSRWKTKGIPKPWLLFLKEKYPRLKALGPFDEDNAVDNKE